MNYIRYKDCYPVNFERVNAIDMDVMDGKYIIRFHFANEDFLFWEFETEEEQNSVYFELDKQLGFHKLNVNYKPTKISDSYWS